MATKYIRLLSGEELVADITGETDDTYTLKQPVQIQMIPNGQDVDGKPKVNIQFVPWPTLTEDKLVVVQKTAVVFVTSPLPQFAQKHTEFTSKIITPLGGPAGGRLITP